MSTFQDPDDDQEQWIGWVQWDDETWSRLGADGFPGERRTVDEIIAALRYPQR